MREFRTLGSVRGAARKGGPYRNRGLLPLRVVLPGNAHQRASHSMGHAEVQAMLGHPNHAWRWLDRRTARQPTLFAHWHLGLVP